MNIQQRIVRALVRGAQLPLPRPGMVYGLSLPGKDIDLRPAKTKQDKLAAFAGWVYAAATTIMTDVGSAQWEIWRTTGASPDDWTALLPNQVPPEIMQPNDIMALQDVLETTQLHLDLVGEAWWHIITQEGTDRMVGFEVIYPNWVQEPVLEEGRLTGWKLAVPGQPMKIIPVADTLYMRYPHPSEPLVGASPVEAFILSHELDMYTRGYGAALMKNNAIPALVITSEQDLSTEDSDLIRERWLDRHQNKPGEPAVFGKGAGVQVLGLTLDKLGLEVIDRMTRDQVFGAYGVPASKKGLVDDVNRANADANERTYQRNVILPRLRRLARAMGKIVERSTLDSRLYVFEFDNPVDDDMDFLLEKSTKLVAGGMLLVNQGLAMVGEDPQPDGDVYLVPNTHTRVPAGMLATLPEEEPRQATPTGRATHIMEDPLYELVEVRYIASADQLERGMVAEVRRTFSQEQRAVLKALRDNWEQIEGLDRAAAAGRALYGPLAKALDEVNGQWVQVFERNSLKASQAGWDLASKQIKGAVAYEDIHGNALKRAKRWSAKRVQDIEATTEKAIRRIVLDGIKEGKSVAQVEQQLRGMYDGFKGQRAATIARTEMTQNINWGQYATARQTQVKTGKLLVKIWVTTLDGHERDTHRAAHGQRRRIDERFNVGSAMLRSPGDNHPAAEVINCRCTMAFKKAYKPRV